MSTKASLCVPASAEYILPVRLFVSGLAARRGFDVGRIEDIKTTVSEACNMLLGMRAQDVIDITIGLDNGLLISASAATEGLSETADTQALDFSEMMIEALCDSSRTVRNGSRTVIELHFESGDTTCQS